MGFKEQFLALPPGPAREALVYNEVISRGPPKNLVPVTVDGPNGIKITYHVMPDYVMVDGIRATMAPATAQKVADHFGMKLPTGKMSKQIYDAADTKVRAVPLSSSGYIGADGKRYSGADVVKSKINNSDAAVEYSKLTDAEIAKQKGNPNSLIAGHGKEILQPLGDPKDVSFGGWQGQNGQALQPYTTAHKGGAETHSEYGLYTRLVGDDITVTTPDGRTINTTMEKLMANPNLGKTISDVNKVVTYNDPGNMPKPKETTPIKINKPTEEVAQYTPNAPQSGRAQLLQRIDNFLSQFETS